jgi:glycosyltransferase involved in cell wall biosynthesis
MGRPTISLACILKNEIHNIDRMLESVKDCYDEIHLTDTGSTDGSLEKINGYASSDKSNNPANTPIFVHHFTWCDDFAAARNASYAPITTDFVGWQDLDDVMSDRNAFIKWRDEVMELSDFWVANYHYASDALTGKPVCTFIRERVTRTSHKFKWNYFVHEGLRLDSAVAPVTANMVTSWAIVHKRSDSDLKADRSRNLKLFKDRMDSLDTRMKYYYGKELFENQQPMEAYEWLVKAASTPDLEPHDRILALQYACMSAISCNQFERAIQLAHQGLQLSPNRAEFHIVIGDSYLKLNRFIDAIPSYNAAIGCANLGSGNTPSNIFTHEDSYGRWPRLQLARTYMQLGNIEMATKYAEEAEAFNSNVETKQVLEEIKKVSNLVKPPKHLAKPCDEIVFSCLPQGFYEWDEEIAKHRGIGGSETAVVQMARHLHDITGLKVRVFNNRTRGKEIDGVYYLPANEIHTYFKDNLPKVNINWRHCSNLTSAPTYIYCHDLVAQGIENVSNYEKVLALSPFHKRFLENMARVPSDKIIVTRNGIDPERFVKQQPKNERKIVFLSSPDRGLDNAIKVCDVVRGDIPDIQLNAYYGFENMLKLGKQDDVRRMQQMMSERPWVRFVGNLQQDALAQELSAASVWLYPTNFLETFCITALEALCSKVYPVTRRYGALSDTLASAEDMGMATMIDTPCVTSLEIENYASQVVCAIQEKKWEKVVVSPDDFSWKRVAQEWIQFLPL